MNSDEESYEKFDPKEYHKKQQAKKNIAREEESKEKEITTYGIKYKGEYLFFDSNKKGEIHYDKSQEHYPVFILPGIEESSRFLTFKSKIDKALSSKKFIADHGEEGIKFLVEKKKGKDIVMTCGVGNLLELKILGGQQDGGIKSGDWRIIGVLDSSQNCIFLLEEAVGHHTVKNLAIKIQTEFTNPGKNISK